MRSLSILLASISALQALVVAHGNHRTHADEPRPDDWATYHLLEEHHISNFDPGSFFTLHDFNNDGYWTADEIHRTYGLSDESTKDISSDTKHSAVLKVLDLYLDPSTPDHYHDRISRAQFLTKTRSGVRLPDLGFGPGHHGDDEYEYEIHHFEKFHGEDATEEELTHPEDIEHFKKHEAMEDEEWRVERMQSQRVVEANIPMKFRRQGL